MIVTRKLAEEARATLEMAPLLENIDEAFVLAMYKLRAMEHHPDKGGTAEKFIAIDRAKHVLLKWLERGGDGPVQPEHKQEDCLRCQGKGHVIIQRAFKQMRVMCITCRGTGDRNYEPEKTDTGVSK